MAERVPRERRALLLLAATSGANPDQVRAELVGRTAPLRQRAADAGAWLRTGRQMAEDPLLQMARTTGREVAPVAAVVEVTGSPDTRDDVLLGVLEGFGNWFGGVFDKSASAAVLGPVVPVTDGPRGPVMLALGTRKVARLSQREFHEYWAETHGRLALSLMPKDAAGRFRYQQLHADEEGSARAADVAGVGIGDYAGVLQVLCARPRDFLDVAGEPSFAKRIYEDELNFAEQSGMRGGFLELDD